jgi:CopG family transcriptional regulator/antitoxin EndoAI
MPAKQARKPPRKPVRTAAKKTAAKKAVKPRKSRVFTISLPPELADRAEAIAREESRTMSELFREALRSYRLERTRKWMEGIAEYVKTLPPTGYTEEDVPRLIKEVRAEMRAEQEQKMRKAG